MEVQDLVVLLWKWGIPGSIGTAIGATLTHFVSSYRGRVQELEYWVKHDRLGLATNDPIHGLTQILWRGQALNNLYSSTLTLKNTTSRDFKELIIAVYSQEPTFLLSEQ